MPDDRNWNLAAPTGNFAGGGSVNGHTAFGTVPGAIPTPPNTFSQVNQAVPGFGNLTSGNTNVINSELSGQVSPATLKAMQSAAATFGVANGVPGSGLQNNNLFGNIAGFSENRQRQGVQDYLGSLGALSHTMTDPGLAAEISSRNSNLAAAPDPQLAAQEQMRQWLQKFGLTSALGNQYGPNGGTGSFRGGRPPDAPSYGGYRGNLDALGNPVTNMSGGAMGNSYYAANPIGYGPQGDGTEHFAAGAGGNINPRFQVNSDGGSGNFNPYYTGGETPLWSDSSTNDWINSDTEL